MNRTAEIKVAVGAIEARALVSGPEGAGEAAVFVHGNPGSADDFADLVATLGETMRAVAIDLPDFGKTAADPGFEHSVEAYAEFLGAALQELRIERAHLVVHDFGGPVGLFWGAANPERVASLTLIDVGVMPGYRWHWMARVWRTPVLGELVQLATTRGAFAAALTRGEPRGLPPAAVARMYAQYDRRTRRAVLGLYRSFDDPGQDASEIAAALAGKPTLVVWGEHDVYLPSHWARRQAEFFPEAEIHVLAASGHWPFFDAPDAVARLLRRFLRERAGVGDGEPAGASLS